MFSVANGLVLLWVWVLWWGERRVFWDSVEMCGWGGWERWVSCLFLSIFFISVVI